MEEHVAVYMLYPRMLASAVTVELSVVMLLLNFDPVFLSGLVLDFQNRSLVFVLKNNQM